MSDTQKPPYFYNKKSRLLKFIPLVIIVVGGLVTGIFVIPMFEASGENKQVTIGGICVDADNCPVALTQSQALELSLNQNVEILKRIEQITEEQKYQRELLEDIYDMES